MKTLHIFICFVILLINISNTVNADVIDSLTMELKTAPPDSKIKILKQLIQNLYLNQPELALKYADEIHNLAMLKNDMLNISLAYYEKGRVYKEMGKYQKSIEYHTKALMIRIDLDNKDKAAESYEKIAQCYFELCRYQNSLEFYQKAYRLNSAVNNIKWMTYDLNYMGYIYKITGRFEKAMEYYHKALDINKKSNNKKNKSLILNRIGSVYLSLRDFDKSLDYYQQALKIREEISYQWGIAGSLNNIGNVYKQMGKTNLALEYFFKALKKNIEFGNQRWRSYNLNNISSVYKKMGEYDKALDYASQSLTIKKKRNDKKGMANSLFLIGEIRTLQGDFERAIENYNKSLSLASEIGAIELERDATQQLSIAYEKINKPAMALQYHKQYFILNDSIMNIDNLYAISEIETKYKTEQKEKENNLLKKNLLLIREREKSQRDIKLLLFFVIVAIIIVMVFVLYNFRLRKKSLEQDKLIAEKKSENYKIELEFRNKELVTNAMHLAQINELTNRIIKDLKSLNYKTDDTGRKTILAIIRNLKSTSKSSTWKEFETRFEKVHSEFYKKLLIKHPELTPTDRKLCAFLRLNMSTKDIAAITYQSTRGIESARLRLRRKLNISSSTNLVNYLINI